MGAGKDGADASRFSYLLGDSPVEIRHLVEQAATYAKEADELFDAIGLAPGIEAIDVGCGVMGVVHLLVERAGDCARVVGLDREPTMIDHGRALAATRGLVAEFLQADATATGLPDASFDFVHARTLLLNVANPAEILAEMKRIGRPGGVVAVQEPDGAGWVCDPPHPAWDILRGAIFDAYRRTGKDFNIGRRIGRLLREAGLEDVRVRPTARVTHPGEFYQTFLPTVARLVRDVIVGSGDLTADEFASYAGELEAHLRAEGTLTCQPIIWQAWGRVPA